MNNFTGGDKMLQLQNSPLFSPPFVIFCSMFCDLIDDCKDLITTYHHP